MPASSVATVPRGNYREAARTTQCQGQKKRERFGDGKRDATTMGLPWTTSCWTKDIGESSGALETGNGANEKEALTAKLPVNAAVDGSTMHETK